MKKSARIPALFILVLASIAFADTLTTNVRFVIPSDLTFSVFIASSNATNVTSSAASTRLTQEVIFNYTTLTLVKGNASATGVTQDGSTAIFQYRNDGNVFMNITLNFTTNMTGRPAASSVVIKAGKGAGGWEDSCTAVNLTDLGTKCVNLTVNFTGNTPPRRVANLTTSSPNNVDYVWIWADWDGLTAGFDQSATLQHRSLMDRAS